MIRSFKNKNLSYHPEGMIKGKEGIYKKGKREGYERSLRGSDQIAKFATLISLMVAALQQPLLSLRSSGSRFARPLFFEGKVLREDLKI